MKALMPAAGLGTRWYPWSKVIPKELLPLGRYPAIHYVLEEAVAAGITEIGIIMSESKQLIRTYVENAWHAQRPKERVVWFYQTSPKGVADALLCAKEWIQDKPTAILYPDEIHPLQGGLGQLRRAYESSPANWIGLTANKHNRRQAILEIEAIEEKVFRITGFHTNKRTQRVGYGTGRYILDSGLTYLDNYVFHAGLQETEELDDDKILESLIEPQLLRGIVLSNSILDVGTPTNWLHAITEFRNADLAGLRDG
jgi:UTP--glucose-1-phosphate uridylyltransferase